MPNRATRSRSSSQAGSRRGIAVLWMVIVVPVLLVMFALILDAANLWLARVELENGLEASALAAVKEWAESPDGTDTFPARKVGVAYACVNRVRGLPIVLGTNFATSGGGPNQNADCCITPGAPPLGNLLFGAIVDDNPAAPVTFDAGVAPSCAGSGLLLFDATGQGGGSLGGPVQGNQEPKDNAWGIAFVRLADTPSDLRIRRVILDLRANGGSGSFNSVPQLSDAGNDANRWFVKNNSGSERQPDIVGFTDVDTPDASTGQIRFTLLNAHRLQIDFFPDIDNTDPQNPIVVDGGFEPCDRMRFGIDVTDVSSGNSGDDGDGIGEDGVGIEVQFETGPAGSPNPGPIVFGRYFNTQETDCRGTALTYPGCNDPPDLIVGVATDPRLPGGIPNLPCPAASSAGNNGQSWTLLGAGSRRPHAVRAQARVEVPTLWRSLFGQCAGPYCITVKTTAMYDCQTGRPRLVLLDDYVCP